MKSRLAGSLVAVLAVLLMATACRNSSGTDGESTPNAQATRTQNTTGALADAECREYAESFSDFNPDPANPAGASSFRQIAEFMESAAGKVPNEVSDDFRTLATAYREFAEGSGDLNFTDPAALASVTPEQLSKMEESLKKLDTEEVRTAAANIEKFVDEHCPQG